VALELFVRQADDLMRKHNPSIFGKDVIGWLDSRLVVCGFVINGRRTAFGVAYFRDF
ncbi:uncharacterized protein METZ01_LOCUS60129, partial [marine metagenome]